MVGKKFWELVGNVLSEGKCLLQGSFGLKAKQDKTVAKMVLETGDTENEGRIKKGIKKQ